MNEEIITTLKNEIGEINKKTIKKEQIILIEKLSKKPEFLPEIFRKENSAFNINLLLTCPFLFQNYDLNSWLQLFKELSPRPEVEARTINKFINSDGHFTDLIFFNKILNVNPIKALKLSSNLDERDFRNCLKFIQSYSYKFFISEEELIEDLNDFYNVTLQELKVYSQSMLKLGFGVGFKNREELEQAVSQELSDYFN